MRFRTPWAALTGYALAALGFLLHLLNVGDWAFQIVFFKLFAPLFSAIPTWLAWRGWRAASRAGLTGARRHMLVASVAYTAMTLSSLASALYVIFAGDASYLSPFPVTQLLDLSVLVLLLVALLLVPVRNRWSSSRLRLGLDMTTVLVAGSLFLWYFLLDPGLFSSGADMSMSVAIPVRIAGLMVVLFAIARIVLGGVAELSRRAMCLTGGACVAQAVLSVMQQKLAHTEHVHLVLASRQVFIALLIAAAVAHLRHFARGGPGAAVAVQRPSSMMPYVAVAAADALLVTALLDGLDPADWVVLGGAIALTALVVVRQIVGLRDNSRLVVRVDASLRALREAVAREQILSDLGTALLRATEAHQVHRLAADAAATVLKGCPGARTAIVTVSPENPEFWTVAHASGADAATLTGTRIPGHAVPAALLARLAAGEVITAPGWARLGLGGLDGFDSRPLMLLPLLNGDRFFGVLSVGTDEAPPADVVKSLHTLRTQASLALDSVALTAELTVRAMHDMLTGLGNRALLRDRLTGALSRSRRTGRPIGVLLLDLNGFKPVNDTYGHDAGDMLLQVVAERLKACVRTEDTVARLGGDEFVVVTEDLREPADALVIAERVVAALNEPVLVDGHLLTTPASIGVALSEPRHSPDDVLRAADAAMYVAKRRGGGHYHVHDGAPESKPSGPPVGVRL